MSLAMGIVGLPNVGKSTLFNALTRKAVSAENYPFCTIDPSVGVVPVPDDRLAKLSEFSRSAETIPAAVEFVDIAGLVKGAAAGEGLGNAFLSNIREVDAVAHITRLFDDPNITHISGRIDPLDDIETITLELILADLETVTRRQESLVKEVKSGDKEAQKEKAVLDTVQAGLEADKPVNGQGLTPEQLAAIQHLHLLSAKPVLFVLNKQIGGKNIDETDPDHFERLTEAIRAAGASFVVVDAHMESEMKDMSPEERREFREGLGAKDSGLDRFIQESYELLGLMTYFTTGEKETRAWTVRRGVTAPEAGAAIHSDFRDKFIRAEVIAWDKLLEAGSKAAAREQGLLRLEGKEYIVKDGEVIEFRI